MTRISAVGGAALGLLLMSGMASYAETAPKPSGALSVVLRPVRAQQQTVTAIDVTMTISQSGSASEQGFGLVAPIVYPGTPGVADRMKNIHVRDAKGELSFTTRDDPAVPGGFPYFRHWTADRAVHYPVTISYRALVQPDGGPNGPPFGIRAISGGVTGAGSSFLLMPKGDNIGSAQLRWDLSGLPSGSIAATSFGERDVRIAGAPSQLMQGWYLAGPAGRYPANGTAHNFSAYWLGTPTFDAPTEMAQAAKAYSWLDGYFPHLKPTPPYRVFMRFLDAPPYGGGTALTQSFMLSRGPLKPGEPRVAPQDTLFHEMIHQWVGGIEAAQGVSSWFSEGLTTYYTHVLPMRGGFQSLDQYRDSINELTRDYFINKARNWSADAIVKVGFGDDQIRHLPYQRGALYFADLDARIRMKSNGKRNLESLLFPLFKEREQGRRFDHARWIELVTQELGPEEKGRFERLILAGTDTLDPLPGAFGPCFTRKATTYDAGGKPVTGYEWVRVPGVADSRCRRW